MTAQPTVVRSAAASVGDEASYGPLGRLGFWTASHFRAVLLVWVVIALGFGVFAPKAQHSLAGAGWEASGSQSVAARQLIDRQFAGLSSAALQVVVHSSSRQVNDPAVQGVIGRAEALLRADQRISRVVPPSAGVSISRDGHTAVIQAGAAADTNAMVRAADALKGPLTRLSGNGTTVALTGSSGLWSDFNAANHTAMMKSELYSWPVTMAILVLAFGSLVAAGLPLMLTIIGLMAAAGSLYLGTQIGAISIWAMNFAMMFALALGIDYALFLVVRFRGARFGRHEDDRHAVAETMDTAGKAVLFSGLTVLISLSAVMLVPSPAFRSMALGIMLAVIFVLGATLTLLPAVLARLGSRVDGLALPWVHAGEHRSPTFARWAERLWRRPIAYGVLALTALIVLALPVLGLRTGMPSIKVIPTSATARVGYDLVQSAFGPGAPGALQVVTPTTESAQTTRVLTSSPGIAHVTPAMPSADGRWQMMQATPTVDPSSKQLGTIVDRLRAQLPRGTLVGGAAAENHDLEHILSARTPLVIGVVLALGFLLLLVALQAPLIAALGVATNLLAVGAAFGVARLIFQNGHGAGLFGFESQHFLDAWAPVFFFAMIFAISMDYTVFLLSSAKEHWEASRGNARDAMVGGVAHSGRVIFAAAGVMVAVFFTFALSGPLPPKEMGVVLGIAVLLDALLIRLLLLPVLLRLTGRWAWACPRWLRRVLPRIRFSHATTQQN
ncbi:MAG TPA: MMPL family transporter [Mycobacteriales bacterium]|jgi:RND superfamily putative drug exporter|nr:MMPL family transporter [Mycobacteriales bacterium]